MGPIPSLTLAQKFLGNHGQWRCLFFEQVRVLLRVCVIVFSMICFVVPEKELSRPQSFARMRRAVNAVAMSFACAVNAVRRRLIDAAL